MGPLKIAIVGSGTAGLAAAAFLKQDGHAVTIFEQFAVPRPLGAGLMLQPTGLACLARLGLDAKAIACGAKILHLHGQSAKGRVVFDLSYQGLQPHLFGLGIHRGALFSILHDAVLSLQVKTVTSSPITATKMASGQRVLIDKAGHQTEAFDLVVDASGAKSVLRNQSLIKYNQPYPYGAIWGVCEDPGQSFGQNHLRQRYDGAGIMIGALAIGKRPTDQKETLAFFWSLPAHSYPDWKDKGLGPWKQKVLGYWPELAPFVEQFKSADDLTFAQYSDIVMTQWHDDHLVFIGDSGHCTSPQLGQGANLGLIDALTLAACLKGGDDINTALARYTNARKSQTRFYQIASRALTPFFQSDSLPAAWVRDKTFGVLCKTPYVRTEMLRTLGGIKTGLFTHLNPGQWHPRYDLRNSQPR